MNHPRGGRKGRPGFTYPGIISRSAETQQAAIEAALSFIPGCNADHGQTDFLNIKAG